MSLNDEHVKKIKFSIGSTIATIDIIEFDLNYSDEKLRKPLPRGLKIFRWIARKILKKYDD